MAYPGIVTGARTTISIRMSLSSAFSPSTYKKRKKRSTEVPSVPSGPIPGSPPPLVRTDSTVIGPGDCWQCAQNQQALRVAYSIITEQKESEKASKQALEEVGVGV